MAIEFCSSLGAIRRAASRNVARGVQRGGGHVGPDAAGREIEGFDVALGAPNTDQDGLISVRGTAEQIAGLREDEGSQRNTIDAQLTVDGIRHIEGYTNEGVAGQMAMYQPSRRFPKRA